MTAKIIALEEHFCPPEILGAWNALPADIRDDHLRPMNDKEMAQKLADFTTIRLAAMDDAGVDVQVLSLTSPAAQIFEPKEAVKLAHLSNDLAYRTIDSNPDRFQAFATLPTADVDESVAELHRCVEELGFRGALLTARTRERPLDLPEFFPILEAAAELGVPIYLHPQVPRKAVRENYYNGFGDQIDMVFSTAGFGWHAETGIMALRLMLAGTFDKLPDLQIIVGHWGEAVLFYLDRIDQVLFRVAKGKVRKTFTEYFCDNFYVTPSGLFSRKYLQQTIDIIGIDRIMHSVDYPYVPVKTGEARRFLTESGLSQEDQDKIASGNWERLTVENASVDALANPS